MGKAKKNRKVKRQNVKRDDNDKDWWIVRLKRVKKCKSPKEMLVKTFGKGSVRWATVEENGKKAFVMAPRQNFLGALSRAEKIVSGKQ